MEEYKVIVLPSAAADLDRIIDYLNTLSPSAAVGHSSAIIEGIDSLTILPNRCPPARDRILADSGYRYLIVKTYLIFYKVSGDTVLIRHIADGRSHLSKKKFDAD